MRLEIADLFDFSVETYSDDVPDPRCGVRSPLLRDVFVNPSDERWGFDRTREPSSMEALFLRELVNCGRLCLGSKKINLSTVFAGQAVGIKEVHDDIWLVSFMDYDLGYFDLDTRVLEPLDNPFGPRLLPM
jgi:hypothetical protein